MKLIWESGFTMEKGMGQQVKGIIHEGERPIEVVVHIEEICRAIRNVVDQDRVLGYLYGDLHYVVKNPGKESIKFHLKEMK